MSLYQNIEWIWSQNVFISSFLHPNSLSTSTDPAHWQYYSCNIHQVRSSSTSGAFKCVHPCANLHLSPGQVLIGSRGQLCIISIMWSLDSPSCPLSFSQKKAHDDWFKRWPFKDVRDFLSREGRQKLQNCIAYFILSASPVPLLSCLGMLGMLGILRALGEVYCQPADVVNAHQWLTPHCPSLTFRCSGKNLAICF